VLRAHKLRKAKRRQVVKGCCSARQKSPSICAHALVCPKRPRRKQRHERRRPRSWSFRPAGRQGGRGRWCKGSISILGRERNAGRRPAVAVETRRIAGVAFADCRPPVRYPGREQASSLEVVFMAASSAVAGQWIQAGRSRRVPNLTFLRPRPGRSREQPHKQKKACRSRNSSTSSAGIPTKRSGFCAQHAPGEYKSELGSSGTVPEARSMVRRRRVLQPRSRARQRQHTGVQNKNALVVTSTISPAMVSGMPSPEKHGHQCFR